MGRSRPRSCTRTATGQDQPDQGAYFNRPAQAGDARYRRRRQFHRRPLDISEFTCKVLKFWAGKGYMFPEWARAANIVFSLSPNSAACERVFSLLQYMFGDTQDGALADYIQTALMLKYNNRAVG